MVVRVAMVQQRVRTYADGDRVRVWRAVGQRAMPGTVIGTADGGVKVRIDGKEKSIVVPAFYVAPLARPDQRRRTGVLWTAGASIVVVAAAAVVFGLFPMISVVRHVAFIAGVVALYVVLRGILIIRDSGDQLRPLPTFDPTKDYTTNNAG